MKIYELHQLLHFLPFSLANFILLNSSVFQHLMIESYQLISHLPYLQIHCKTSFLRTSPKTSLCIKKTLQTTFCVDINTHSDRKWEIMKDLFKKLFFPNVLFFIFIFCGYHYPRYFLYSDCMWPQVCTSCNLIFFTEATKKTFLSINSFFLQTMVFIR